MSAIGFGSSSMVHGNEELLVVQGLFTAGNGAADMTAVYQNGIRSVTYNSATGKFLVTLTSWPGVLMDVEVKNHRASGTAPLVGSPVWASVDKDAKTIPVEIWDMGTPSLTNPANGTNVTIKLVFKKTK